MSSTTFQRLSERTKNSKAFFYGFCAVLGSIPVTLGYFTMKFTNSNNALLEARLRQSADPNLTKVGMATTAKMNEFLGELQRKEKQKADDRYFAALGRRPSRNPGVSTQREVEASKNIIDGDV
ncbi:hypothetical protein POM88_016114 [Heracleum sosnowskyi]|uniref:Transmembrane protein n=1 Tax=Heracleum sosnowskyi TaxID=360622 RepID=A0AAD8ILY6_9APIA|nr:hypothetical protein POM88_016114 [Heracleum sosnowskyi]